VVNFPTQVESDARPGQFIDLHITRAFSHSLRGEILASELATGTV
jgi:hypothetical protein